jgi:hypothetical protein
VLDNDLTKVWQATQPHVSVRELRDWFARYPYLSKLRDSLVLARAISEALVRSDAKYAIADRFDEMRSEYVNLKLGRLVEVDLNSDMVLVWRAVAEAQIAKHASQSITPEQGSTGTTTVRSPISGQDSDAASVTARTRPRRFYAKITLDPTRPTPQVSNIAQSILSELDRVRGTTVTLTLDIDADNAAGFPEDVESIVRDNAGSLRITDFGFEGE